jgi:hypothetical protein
MIYEQKERQRKVVEIVAIVIGVGVVGSFIVWLTAAILKSQGII